MVNSILSNGLLGMGGFSGGKSMPGMSSLLGEFYDPAELRKAQMKQMLLGMGVGLMSEKGIGRGAELALTMGNQAGDDYRQMALDAYRMKTAKDELDYRRQQDEEADAWRQKQWDYNVGRDQKADAWTSTERQRQLEQWQTEDDMRTGQQNAVQGFTQDFKSQGGDLFEPGMQSWLRGQGVSGVNPQDTQRYNKMQPYMAAQDYGGAFQQMTAEPAPIEPPKSRTIRRGNQEVTQEWNPQTYRFEDIAVGDAFKTTPDVVNNIGGNDDFDKKLMGGVADVYTKQFEQGFVAAQTKQATQQLRGLMEGQGGALDGLAATVAPYLPKGMLPEGANDLVAAQAIVSGLIPKQRVPGSGTTSDYDAKMFAQSLPSIWNQPGANEIILNTIEAYSDYQLSVSNIIADVAADPNIKNKSGAIRDAIKTLPDPFAEWKQAIGASEQQQQATPRIRRFNPKTGKIE